MPTYMPVKQSDHSINNHLPYIVHHVFLQSPAGGIVTSYFVSSRLTKQCKSKYLTMPPIERMQSSSSSVSDGPIGTLTHSERVAKSEIISDRPDDGTEQSRIAQSERIPDGRVISSRNQFKT